MSFWIGPKEDALDLVTERMHQNPDMAPRYDAIKEIRENQPEIGGVARANGMYRVASLQGTLADLAQVLDPNWLHNGKNFYRWLDQHPQHCTYDRRKEHQPNQITFQDGKVVV